MAMISIKITRDSNAEYFQCDVGDTVQVSLEEYVAAVVASEIGNALLEACKAQAVAARTFAVSKGVLSGKTISDSSSSDQAYRANRYNRELYPNAITGTEETAGQILTYNGKPINAVYSSNNGGRTVSAKERWGSDRPYLIAFDDPWDNSTKRTGHGVGMSQRGAKYAASVGKNYEEILEHYYPGTQIETIADTTAPTTDTNSHTTDDEKGGDQLVTASEFIDKVWIPLNENWGYIYGTWGSLWTQEKQDAATREQTVKYGQKWVGHMVTDCSGLVRWAMKQLGVDVVHHATYQYTDASSPKGKLKNGQRTDGQPLLPGTLVFLQGSEAKIHHVGVYVGDGVVIEAKGTQSGVVTSGLDKWDHWGQLKTVDYTDAADDYTPETPSDADAKGIVQGVVDNPHTWLNVRSKPSDNAQQVFQVQKGAVVDILATSNDGKWYQIRYGGRIGWASAKYIDILPVEEEPDQPDVEPDEPDFDEDINVPDTPEIEPEEGYILTPEQLNTIINAANSLNDVLNQIGGLL